MPTLSTVRKQAVKLTALAHAENTHSVYDQAWASFNKFAVKFKVDMWHMEEQDLIDFIAFLSLAGLAPSTIHTYTSGLKHHLRIRLLPDFAGSFLVSLVLKGLHRQDVQPDVRIPVSFKMLQRMCYCLNYVTSSPYLTALYQAMLCLGFHALLRPGELTDSPHAIQSDRILITNTSVMFHLDTSKCNQAGPPQLLTVNAIPSITCPVAALKTYLYYRPIRKGPLFLRPDGETVKYMDLARILNKLSEFLQLPRDFIKPHSLRIGGTTHLHLIGRTKKEIQESGRWSSECFSKYIRV